PVTQPVREEIWKTLLAELGGVAKQMDQDPYVHRYTARAHIEMGKIFVEGRRPTEGLKRYQQAHALLARLEKEDPNVPANKHNLAASLNVLGDTYLLLGDEAKATDCYR